MGIESALAKLTPGTIDPGEVRVDGLPDLTLLEIQMGLAAIQDYNTRLVIQANYLQGDASISELVGVTDGWFYEVQPKKQPRTKEMNEKLSILVVDDFTDRLKKWQRSAVYRAEFCDVAFRTWKKNLSADYEKIYDRLSAMNSHGVFIMKRAMGK